MNTSLNVGSIFSGVGGFEIGLTAASDRFKTVWQAESDPYCLDVLARHFPDVPRYEDVRHVKKEKTDRRYQTIDVLVGGSPCQGLSVGGRRGGLSDQRSRLFIEFIRILNEFKPLWFIWENVPGVFSSGKGYIEGRGIASGIDFGIVLSAFSGGIIPLPDRGWGNAGLINGVQYNLAYRVLDSHHWGVPQRRRRVFVVGGLRSAGLHPAQILFESSGFDWYREARNPAQAKITESLDLDPQSIEIRRSDNVTPTNGKNHDGSTADSPSDLNPEMVGTLAANGGGGSRMAGQGNELSFIVVQSVNSNGFGVFTEGDESAVDCSTKGRNTTGTLITYAVKTDNTKSNGLGVLGDGTTHTLGGAKDAILNDEAARRLTPREWERLQAFPDDWTICGASGNPISDTQRYKMMGNAVTTKVIKWIGGRLIEQHDIQYKPPQ